MPNAGDMPVCPSGKTSMAKKTRLEYKGLILSKDRQEQLKYLQDAFSPSPNWDCNPLTSCAWAFLLPHLQGTLLQTSCPRLFLVLSPMS